MMYTLFLSCRVTYLLKARSPFQCHDHAECSFGTCYLIFECRDSTRLFEVRSSKKHGHLMCSEQPQYHSLEKTESPKKTNKVWHAAGRSMLPKLLLAKLSSTAWLHANTALPFWAETRTYMDLYNKETLASWMYARKDRKVLLVYTPNPTHVKENLSAPRSLHNTWPPPHLTVSVVTDGYSLHKAQT